jgi:hypothetical protein
MKEFKVQVPEGYEIDKEKSTFESIVFKEKNNLPTSWEKLHLHIPCVWEIYDEEYIALDKLRDLLEAYNGDWKPDWSVFTSKYCVHLYQGKWIATRHSSSNGLFTFETEKKRDHFLNHHIDLLNKVKPLYGG